MFNTALPNPPSPPTATIVNVTTMNISWSPPWQHPVESYNLSITNEASNETHEISTSIRSYIFSKGSTSDCTVFSFRVSAVTDVGTSELSNATYKGFPKGCKTSWKMFHSSQE